MSQPGSCPRPRHLLARLALSLALGAGGLTLGTEQKAAEASATLTELRDLHGDSAAGCIGKSGTGQPGIDRGESPTIFKANTEDRWYLFIDEFGGRGYVPFESTNLAGGQWTMSTDYQLPARTRHGTARFSRSARPNSAGSAARARSLDRRLRHPSSQSTSEPT